MCVSGVGGAAAKAHKSCLSHLSSCRPPGNPFAIQFIDAVHINIYFYVQAVPAPLTPTPRRGIIIIFMRRVLKAFRRSINQRRALAACCILSNKRKWFLNPPNAYVWPIKQLKVIPIPIPQKHSGVILTGPNPSEHCHGRH